MRDLHRALIEIVIAMNRPQQDDEGGHCLTSAVVRQSVALVPAPSSAPSGHLLPQRGEGEPAECSALPPSPVAGEYLTEDSGLSPSPLAGEGARRADEGAGTNATDWRTTAEVRQ